MKLNLKTADIGILEMEQKILYLLKSKTRFPPPPHPIQHSGGQREAFCLGFEYKGEGGAFAAALTPTLSPSQDQIRARAGTCPPTPHCLLPMAYLLLAWSLCFHHCCWMEPELYQTASRGWERGRAEAAWGSLLPLLHAAVFPTIAVGGRLEKKGQQLNLGCSFDN